MVEDDEYVNPIAHLKPAKNRMWGAARINYLAELQRHRTIYNPEWVRAFQTGKGMGQHPKAPIYEKNRARKHPKRKKWIDNTIVEEIRTTLNTEETMWSILDIEKVLREFYTEEQLDDLAMFRRARFLKKKGLALQEQSWNILKDKIGDSIYTSPQVARAVSLLLPPYYWLVSDKVITEQDLINLTSDMSSMLNDLNELLEKEL